MRLKHNKKRNTAFVYEALIRELTKSIIKKHKNKQNVIVSIIKEHFSKGSVLKKELDLYKTIYETRQINKRLAEKVILETKVSYSQIDKKRLFKEQTALINKINKSLSSGLFSSFVPNYRNIASIYSIFNDSVNVKEKIILEEKMIEYMSGESSTENNIQPIDNIVYKSFVSKFNEKYSEELLPEQKSLLTKYISSFSDNGLEMKIFLNEEIGRLKDKLLEYRKVDPIKDDEEMAVKTEKIVNILESFSTRPVVEDDLEIVLTTQKLVSEIEAT